MIDQVPDVDPSSFSCVFGEWVAGCPESLTTSAAAIGGAVIATFVGAWIALKLEERRRGGAERERRLGALRKAQFVLAMQLNTLEIIRREHLAPYQERSDRAFKLLPISHDTPHHAIDFESMSFILGSNPGLLQDLHIANANYFSSMGALRERNAEHHRFQERYREVEPPFRVDEPTAKMLNDRTDALYDAVDSGIIEVRRVDQLLVDATTKLFGSKDALRVTVRGVDQDDTA